jgi:hypothetical protein
MTKAEAVAAMQRFQQQFPNQPKAMLISHAQLVVLANLNANQIRTYNGIDDAGNFVQIAMPADASGDDITFTGDMLLSTPCPTACSKTSAFT